jgi:hypothetical protein
VDVKKVGLCHNGMAQPLVVDEKDALQTPNKLSRTSEKRRPSRLRRGKKCYEMFHETLVMNTAFGTT